VLQVFIDNKMFRRFLAYATFSALGAGVLQLFLLLSVHMLYENPMYTGIVGFLMAAPHIISFVVGPVIDRNNKVLVMRITTLFEFIVVALLAFTPLLEQFGVVIMFVVAAVFSFAALFERPATTALLPQVVEENQILQANSLFQMVATFGGLIIAVALFLLLGAGNANFAVIYGVSAVFLALAFLLSLFLKDPSEKKIETDSTSYNYLKDLKEAVRFIRSNVLLFIIIAMVLNQFFAEMANVNRPAFLEYHVGVQGYIIFTVAALVGNIFASALMGSLGKKVKIGRLIFGVFVLAGVIRIAFAYVLPVSFAGGLATIMIYAVFINMLGITVHSLHQKIPLKEMVGRVDTMSTTFQSIFVTFGALAGGFLGSIVSDVAHVFIFQGIMLLLIALFVLFIPSIRKLPVMEEVL